MSPPTPTPGVHIPSPSRLPPRPRPRPASHLELRHVDVEGTVEAEGGRQGGDDLGDEAVEVGVRGALDVEGAAADVVHGLVIEHDGHVGVLEERVRGEHRVVGLDHSRGDLGGGVHGEAELGLLAVVHRQALEEERAEAGARTATHGVEDEEALKTRAVVRELADAVEAEVDNLLADRVVAAGEVVGGVLLARDKLLGVEELPVGAGADLRGHVGWHVSARRWSRVQWRHIAVCARAHRTELVNVKNNGCTRET